MFKNPWVVVGIIVAVLFGGAIALSGKTAQENNEGVVIQPNIKGNPDAAVELVEYSDFACPACASILPVIEEIVSQYGDDIRFEYRHFPLPIRGHEHAQSAAVAAEAAGQQGKFFEYHDLLFANQQEWVPAAVPTSFYIKYAEELELDLELFRRHLNASVLREHVQSDFNESRELGLTGTPSFVLNGTKMEYENLEEFLAQIAFAVDPAAASSSGLAAPQGTPVRFGI
jgi:protein-disulfide isomerase